MAKMTNDEIGHAAEVVANLHLTRLVGPPFNRVLFRVVHLGAKYPTADYLVDALATGGTPLGHFFVQVKGTMTASTTAPRLTIDVERDQFNRLVRFPVPAYLLGVDIRAEQSYLVAACRRRRQAVSSVTKAFPLYGDAGKIALYREVAAFWATYRPTRRASRFHDV